MTGQLSLRRRGARAILIDDLGQLVLIRRTRPGIAPYWTTAGGGVEPSDVSTEAAMHREILEELGATATGALPVFLSSSVDPDGVRVAHYFVARLIDLDISIRHGPEFLDPARGRYDVQRISLYGHDLASIDLRPPELKHFILANREALLIEAGL
jgi:8-oxo-dGTP pyrophosphatase MutT (NUDIX family)